MRHDYKFNCFQTIIRDNNYQSKVSLYSVVYLVLIPGDFLPEEITVLESIRRFDKIVPRIVDVTHVVPDLQTQTAHALKFSQSAKWWKSI